MYYKIFFQKLYSLIYIQNWSFVFTKFNLVLGQPGYAWTEFKNYFLISWIFGSLYYTVSVIFQFDDDYDAAHIPPGLIFLKLGMDDLLPIHRSESHLHST